MTKIPIPLFTCIVCEKPLSLAYEQENSICPKCQDVMKKAKADVRRKNRDGTKKVGGSQVILTSQIRRL